MVSDVIEKPSEPIAEKRENGSSSGEVSTSSHKK
jgi:hypothetical protein